MTVLNLTPHTITLRDSSGEDHTISSSGVARVESTPGHVTDVLGDYGGTPVYSATEFGEVRHLPEPREGVVLIVSQLVASRVPGRRDVVYPGTGPHDGAVRDDGRVVAVTRLISAAAAVHDRCIYCAHDCGIVCVATGRGASRMGWDCPNCGGN